ncbi:MAG: serine hydrolase [Sphingomonadaceae bacterium]
MRALLLTLILVAAPLPAAPPADFAATVEALRREVGAVGISIAIVEGGETTLARGWGERELGRSVPVDADTIFETGSTGKAVTAAALALLVDEGRIAWDDPVIRHLPWFRMHDPWVTREITVRDLLVHRSGLGLGQGDLLFVPRSRLSRRETVERIAHLAPKTSFRSAYAYDNILYAVAGQIIEDVTGKTWEDFVRSRVLRAGGMRTATTDGDERRRNSNRARPHARVSGEVRGLGPQQRLDERQELGRAAAPAGGLAFSALDQAQWLKIQLAQGALPEGGRLWSERQSAEMWQPVVLLPSPALPAPLSDTRPAFQGYALGWQVQHYRGERLILHGGAVFGAIARVVLIPERGVGFAIMMNSEDSGLMQGLTWKLIDHYLAIPDRDWPTKWQQWFEGRLEAQRASLGSAAVARAEVGPSLDLARYAGRYRDPWYGDVLIALDGQSLLIDFTTNPGMRGRLSHWQYDTFLTEFPERGLEPALVTFALDADGKVTGITMRRANPQADFSWNYQDLDLKPVAAP